VTEIVKVKGPLDDLHLGWLAGLYGAVDDKYASLDYVRHQFVRNPFGWSAHAFAVDDGRAVGHTGVVPFAARLGDAAFTVGKLEALVVDPAYRGKRLDDGESIAIGVLRSCYAFGHECGIDVLFGLAPPNITPIHVRAGCRRVDAETPTYVLVTQPGRIGPDWPRRRRAAVAGLAVLQNTLVVGASAATRGVGRAVLDLPVEADAALAHASAGAGEWTVSGDDAWDWYVGSDLLRALEIPGRNGSRAILRLRDRDSIQVVAWRARRPGVRPALELLASLRRLARRTGAPTVRFQPWDGSGGNGDLARACRLLGLVRREEAELVLHTSDPSFDELAIRMTPFFYVTF